MTIGTQLQEARNLRKLTYGEVTEKTKIQPWVLEAIEADRLQDVMSPVYVKGFIGSYAKFLHVDPEPLLAQLNAPKAEPTIAEALPPPQPALPPVAISWPKLELPKFQMPKVRVPKLQMPAIRMPRIELPTVRLPKVELPQIPLFIWRRVGAGLLATALIAGVVIAKPKIALPKFQIAMPKISLPKFAKADAKKKTAKAVAVKPKKVASAPKPAVKKVTTAAASTASQPAAAAKLVQVAAEAPAIQAASVGPVADSLTAQAAPSLNLVPTQPMELDVIATKTTWIKVWADGKLLSQQRLPRGAKERWTAKRQFQLIIAKPSQVDVTLNGQSISPFTIAHQGRVLITHTGVARLPDNSNP